MKLRKIFLLTTVLSLFYTQNSFAEKIGDFEIIKQPQTIEEKAKTLTEAPSITNSNITSITPYAKDGSILDDKPAPDPQLEEDLKDPVKKSLYILVRFIDSNARLSGGALVCNPPEAKYIETCVDLSLYHWKEITGVDLNKIKFENQNDLKLKQIIKKQFTDERQRAYDKMLDNQQLCGSYNEMEKASPLWSVCERSPESFATPPQIIPKKYDDTNLQ